MITFILKRFRSLKFAIRGMYLLIKTEHAIITQSIAGVILICTGFYFDISRTEWMIQLVIIGNVLAIEGLNTAVEKLCDFVHDDYNKQIGFIKDIAAGAISFIAIFSLIILALIYVPYLM